MRFLICGLIFVFWRGVVFLVLGLFGFVGTIVLLLLAGWRRFWVACWLVVQSTFFVFVAGEVWVQPFVLFLLGVLPSNVLFGYKRARVCAQWHEM